jgi:hypothetical protein
MRNSSTDWKELEWLLGVEKPHNVYLGKSKRAESPRTIRRCQPNMAYSNRSCTIAGALRHRRRTWKSRGLVSAMAEWWCAKAKRPNIYHFLSSFFFLKRSCPALLLLPSLHMHKEASASLHTSRLCERCSSQFVCLNKTKGKKEKRRVENQIRKREKYTTTFGGYLSWDFISREWIIFDRPFPRPEEKTHWRGSPRH